MTLDYKIGWVESKVIKGEGHYDLIPTQQEQTHKPKNYDSLQRMKIREQTRTYEAIK